MAKGNTVSIDALRPELWAKDVMATTIDSLFFFKNGMVSLSYEGMLEGDPGIVQIDERLKKSKGDTVTLGLTAKHDPNTGVSDGGEIEGQENKRTPYSESIAISSEDFAERLTGVLDEQKNAYDMRKDAKEKLAIQQAEFIEMQIFLKLAGVTNTTLTDVSGNVVGTKCTWSNTPTYIPDATTAAGYGSRYLCADYTSGAASLASTDLITPNLISRCKVKAMVRLSGGMPKMRPLRINGRQHYVLFIHPRQGLDLKNNAVWAQAQREANVRGSENPIFSAAIGIWDNVIVHEHDYVPFLDISVAGNSFRGASTGTDFTADCYRALFCGAQAVGFVKCNYGPNNRLAWVEKDFNYGRQPGFCTGIMGGIDKLMFNSIEYGVLALDTAATEIT